MSKKDKLLEQAAEHISGEAVLASVEGTYEAKSMGNDILRKGVLIATDQRVVFYAKKLGGYDLESFPYRTISSFDQGKNMMGATVTIYASGNKAEVKWIKDAALPELTQTVRERMVGAQPTPPPAPVSAAPVSAPVASPALDRSPIALLGMLSALREADLLTPEEYTAKKLVLVEQM